MVDLALLQSVSYIAGAFGVCMAAFYYVYNMRAAERNKKIQLSLSITEKIGGKEFQRDYLTLWKLDWKDVNDFLKKYDASVNTEEARERFAQRHSMWLAYDNLGYLLRQGLLNDELVFNAAGYDSIDIWARYWPVIDYYRRTEVGPRWYENFEFLARRMWEMGKTRGSTSPDFKGGLYDDRYKNVYEPKAAVSSSQ